MKPGKYLLRVLFLTVILFTTIKNLSYADGGFPVRPGRLLISPSVSYFFANSEWDSTGVKNLSQAAVSLVRWVLPFMLNMV